MCADITLPEPQPLTQAPAPAPFGNSSQRFKGDELQQQCEQDEQEEAESEQKAKSYECDKSFCVVFRFTLLFSILLFL